MDILGISAFYHDAAAALVRDGKIVAAAQEERFTRVKHDASFPVHALRWCLEAGGGRSPDLVVFYEKPLRKLERLLRTHFAVAPSGLGAFVRAMPSWLTTKLWTPASVEEGLAACGVTASPPLWYCEHHRSHAASAFYPSPFDKAAVLTVDGVGEWATATLAEGDGTGLTVREEQHFPHSVGLLYSTFTAFLGFRVNNGEYKVMGLAPYGTPRFAGAIRSHLVELREDGSIELNLEHFAFLDKLVMYGPSFEGLFGPARRPEEPLTQRHADLARSLQAVTEEILLTMARRAHAVTGADALCLAGGVALNCVANGRILREGPFAELWVQPAAGDAGGALGAALWAAHARHGAPRVASGGRDRMRGARLGPSFSDADIRGVLERAGVAYRELAEGERAVEVARLLDEGRVVGIFSGAMEFGPRALGGRSILADARRSDMQQQLNRRIKFREGFRPFAPVCLAHRAAEWFDVDRPLPYMTVVVHVREERRTPTPPVADGFVERAAQVRSVLPAITHVDHTARLQTVDAEGAPLLHAVLSAFEARTGCPVLVNTSFNLRGEPIVCTPEDAFRCWARSGMDAVLLGSFLVEKQARETLL